MNPFYIYDHSQRLSVDLSFKNIISLVDDRQIDLTAIIEVINKHHIFSDRTLVEGVYKSPWMAKPTKDYSGWEFADLPRHGSHYSDEKEVAEELFSRLQNEIFDHCKDKNSVGILLSGGMDSRITAGALEKVIKDRNLDLDVVAITWGVDNTRDVEYARIVASRLGWEWIYLKLTPNDLINNIKVAAERGCEYSPIHLHAMPRVRELKGLDAILVASYGDSVGRAVFSGKHISTLNPMDHNLSNWFKFIQSNYYETSHHQVSLDIESYHRRFPRSERIEYLEVEQQAHYMRRMLNPCVAVISEKIPIYQVFSAPKVFGYMWSLAPFVRNDSIYWQILKLTNTDLSNVPWSKTGMQYFDTEGRPDKLEKLTIPYGYWIRNDISETIKNKVFNANLDKLNVFNFDALHTSYNLNKKISKGDRATKLDEIFIWLAALSDFVEMYDIKGRREIRSILDTFNGQIISPMQVLALAGKNFLRNY